MSKNTIISIIWAVVLIVNFLITFYVEAAVDSLNSTRQTVKGIYALGTPNKLFSQRVAANPYVDGLAVRTVWNSVEPLEGQYNWSFLDSAFSQANRFGKKVSLSISAGKSTPGWVYAYGIKTFSFIDSQPYHKNDFCTEVKIPVPFDKIYLEKWKNFIRAVGARYGNNPALTRIRISGVNQSSAEIILPHNRGGSINNCDKFSYNDINHWINAGYTATLIKNTWLDIAKTFQAAFPGKGLSSAVYYSSLPKINDSGRYDSKLNLAKDILDAGAANLGFAFIPEENGLSAFYAGDFIKDRVPNSAIGYQMLWWVTGDDTYRMNKRIAGDSKTIFKAAVDNGINSGGDYLEIYPVDIDNIDFQDILQFAQKQTN